jgi:hypothetical protein
MFSFFSILKKKESINIAFVLQYSYIVIILWRKAIMKTTIGIFRGKAKENNKFLLETLYNVGPLSAWELTREAKKFQRVGGGRHSLHAIFNKRLRDLEKKGYIKRVKKKWLLQFKGIIAILIIQSEPKPWNEKWINIFENYVKPLKTTPKKYTITEDGKEIASLNEIAIKTPIVARDFERWVVLSDYVKKLMKKGLINLDIIKNESLLSLILTEVLLEFPEKEV